ncbi:MAG: TRAP transporter substrate-binding protein DctP [Desulfobacteraceae bacterium]|jgi:TRAP-type C4-dicarboxylate transport system substrate-binding protein|nr:TRAP transporter substrate-binding protein DctP [Desulfobacteraceae bacterium]
MKIKRLYSIALAAFLLISTGGEAVSKTMVIKLATLAPEGSIWTEIFNDLDAELKTATNNGVRLKIYPGGVLGNEKDMIRKMFIGQIHGAVLTSAGLSNIFNEMDVFQIPFLFNTYDEVDDVLKNMDGFFKESFADKGYILPAWTEGGFIRLMSTKPIASLDDLRKSKVWTWEDAPMAKAIFYEAGISAIPLSLPDVLVGLQTGLVDVVYAPPSGAITLQWFNKTKYMTDFPLMYLIGGIVIKKNFFEKLSSDHRQLLLELCSKYMDRLKLEVRKENQEAITVMSKHGVKLIRPSEEQINEFKDLSIRAMNRQVGKSFSKKIKNEVLGYVEEYRKKNDK